MEVQTNSTSDICCVLFQKGPAERSIQLHSSQGNVVVLNVIDINYGCIHAFTFSYLFLYQSLLTFNM